ncbi:MAG: TIGR02757 family protein [Acidobacteriota bacterium]
MPLSDRERFLGERLEELYLAYGPETRNSDPIVFVGRYESPADREVVGWIASAFAYGRVATIQTNVAQILAALGPRPSETLDRIEDFARFTAEALPAFRHRFHGPEDAAALLLVIANARREAGSVGAFFERELRLEESDVAGLLSRVVARIEGFDFRPALGVRSLPARHPARFFFPDPAAGSACKRWNLYLRWMVRKDLLDFGLWPEISPARLVIPTDTHIHLVARRLGLTRRRSADWRTAREITDRLARFDAADPVRFDYALCRIGIFGICQPRAAMSRCSECAARQACATGKRRAA